jgi:hypothetical protein
VGIRLSYVLADLRLGVRRELSEGLAQHWDSDVNQLKEKGMPKIKTHNRRPNVFDVQGEKGKPMRTRQGQSHFRRKKSKWVKR